jgi:hypothetical protein
MQETVRTKAAGMVEQAIGRLHRLHATGPNPFDYWLWADETVQALETIFGPDAEETRAIAEIVYARGRTATQRGAMDNMTLGIHGEWGIHARLDRAKPVLVRIRDGLLRDA